MTRKDFHVLIYHQAFDFEDEMLNSSYNSQQTTTEMVHGGSRYPLKGWMRICSYVTINLYQPNECRNLYSCGAKYLKATCLVPGFLPSLNCGVICQSITYSITNYCNQCLLHLSFLMIISILSNMSFIGKKLINRSKIIISRDSISFTTFVFAHRQGAQLIVLWSCLHCINSIDQLLCKNHRTSRIWTLPTSKVIQLANITCKKSNISPVPPLQHFHIPSLTYPPQI